jgi:hypothetical protein
MATKPQKIGLMRDVLDKLLLDRDDLPVGRADGLILVTGTDHSQPRLTHIESGASTLARRLRPTLATSMHRFYRRIGIRWRRPIRIEWSNVESVGKELKLKFGGEDSPLTARERWLRDHLIRRIPGNGFKPGTET